MTRGGLGEVAASGGEISVRPSAAPSGGGAGITWTQVVARVGVAGNWLEKAIEVAIVLVLAAELVVVFSNIVMRTVTGVSHDWVQEITELALVFLTFVGGALAYRRGAHMRVHAGINALPKSARPYVEAGVDAAVFVIALFLIQQSIEMLKGGGPALTGMLRLPITWMRSPVLIGMSLMALFAFGQLFSYPKRVVLPATAVVAVAVGLMFTFTATAIPADQALIITLVVFILMLMVSVPIGFVFTAITLLYLQQTKLSMLTAVPLKMQYGAASFVMLAIPFFILAGNVMTEGGLAVPMSNFIASIIGRLRGGLLQVIVVTMYVFSGISGSKVADMVAVGSSLSVMLKRGGYSKGETAAVLAASAAMGETVPPSIAMLVFSSVSTLSVASLFVAGFLPAALIALCLMVAIYFRASKLGLHGSSAIPLREVGRRGFIAIPAFAMPIMLLVGILSGISTPTEVSSFAVVYGVGMAVFVYRKVDAKALWRMVHESASMTGNILFVIAAANAFSWALTFFQVPQRLAELLNVFQGQPWAFMLFSVIFMVLMGSFLEGLPMILVCGPILLPIVAQFGVTELQFGIMMVIATGVGFFSPPVGIGIYFACNIAGTTMEETLKPMLYYMAILMIGLLLVAFIPEVSLILPRLFGLSIR